MKAREKRNNLSVTIGICTSFAGPNLLRTAHGIKQSAKGSNSKLVIYADKTPVTITERTCLQKYGFTIHWTSGPGSFFKKARKLIAATSTDILILTQDDILFDTNTIKNVTRAFEKYPRCTMVGIRVLPLPPKTIFEKTMTSMVRIVDRISMYWNGGDNYLAASGRCLAFRTAMIQSIALPEVVNGDMYLYLENMKQGGVFMRSTDAFVYIRAPNTYSDQIRPSSRYQYSRTEMEQWFNVDLRKIYTIPGSVLIRSFMYEFVHHPVFISLYLAVFIITRLKKKKASEIMHTVWNPDESTKIIHPAPGRQRT